MYKKSFIKISFLLFLFVAAAAVSQCRSPNKKIKDPVAGRPTEFHREPAKLIPIGYFSINDRGVDNREDVSYFSSMGFGLGLFINQPTSKQWLGHKFLYYYIDIEGSPEHYGDPYPGEKNWVFATSPGVYMRTYLPLWVKLHYGVGLNMRFGSNYDRWGMYGQMGVEWYGFTASTVVIGYPGQPNWDTEYRFGYMYAPINN